MRETNDLDQISWSIELKGRIELAEGNLSSAHQLLNEPLAISEKNNNQFSGGFLRTALGLIDCYEGNFTRGKEAIELGIEKVRQAEASSVPHLLAYRSHALWLEKDLQGAARSYRDTINELHHNYVFIRIPECLEGLGKIAVVKNDFERAARLFGAAEAIREKMGTPIPPVMRGDYEAHVQSLGTTYESSWRQGRGMTMDEIIQFAVEENAS